MNTTESRPHPWERGFGLHAGRDIAGLSLRDLPLPVLVLRESAVAHNLAVMARWCAERGVSLAPHGKTTMAPALIRRQLEAGAWGMTAASVPQLTVMRDAGGLPDGRAGARGGRRRRGGRAARARRRRGV